MLEQQDRSRHQEDKQRRLQYEDRRVQREREQRRQEEDARSERRRQEAEERAEVARLQERDKQQQLQADTEQRRVIEELLNSARSMSQFVGRAVLGGEGGGLLPPVAQALNERLEGKLHQAIFVRV